MTKTCTVHNCDELRAPLSPWCLVHRANEAYNGSVYIAKRTASFTGPGCAVCHGRVPASRAMDGTCSKACEFRLTLSSGRRS